ncbi:MAG TPA: DUF6279 family lipoprotein, partial [Burkholderiaceae bacterium]|nr:DUF6279 family lipoprotein [Burkholderiaceae bacterium]
SVRLGYNNADTLVLYLLNSYLDLDETQQRVARDGTRALLDWHRRSQLAEYVTFIDSAQVQLEGPVAPRQVLAFTLGFNQRLAAIGEQAAPTIAALALTLQPEQLERLEKKLAQDLKKARREVVRYSGGDAVGERTRIYAERVENWFGSVSDAQLALIRESLATRTGGDQWWLEERAQRQRELLVLARRIQDEQPTAETAAQWVREYLVTLREPPTPERRARIEAWRLGNAELVTQLVNTADAEQKRHLLGKLRGYAEDFNALATEANRTRRG